jgi:3-methyladenine DNA glycosylase/8-oxoguanine DNA glycosylase
MWAAVIVARMTPDAAMAATVSAPYDLRGSTRKLGLAKAARDTQVRDDGFWRTSTTPEGPVTLRMWRDGEDVGLDAWGAGSDWAIARGDRLLGLHDDPMSLQTDHPLVRQWQKRFAGIRMVATLRVVDRLIPVVFQQLVSGAESKRSWSRLMGKFGRPAPGPVDMLVAPDPKVLRDVPGWQWQELGALPKMGRTIRHACDRASRLEEAALMTLPDAARRLQAIPGIGPWTAQSVLGVVLGDADAVPPGDDNLPDTVAFALANEPRANDARMFELLEPFAGHRRRVLGWIGASGIKRPRYGPRGDIRPLRY